MGLQLSASSKGRDPQCKDERQHGSLHGSTSAALLLGVTSGAHPPPRLLPQLSAVHGKLSQHASALGGSQQQTWLLVLRGNTVTSPPGSCFLTWLEPLGVHRAGSCPAVQPHKVGGAWGGGGAELLPLRSAPHTQCSLLSVLTGRNPSHICARPHQWRGKTHRTAAEITLAFFPPRNSSYGVPEVSSRAPLSNTPGGISLRFGLSMNCNRKQSISAQGGPVKLGGKEQKHGAK